MSGLLLSVVAGIAYALATRQAWQALHHEGDTGGLRPAAAVLAAVAVITHGAALALTLPVPGGIDLGIGNAASLVAWLSACWLPLVLPLARVEGLAVVLFPAAIATLPLLWWPPTHRVVPPTAPLGLEVHIAASIAAYCILGLAALVALLVRFADLRLHQHRPHAVLDALPPLQSMERTLFQLITAGFVLLTVGLATGLLYVDNLFAQHLVHKTVLSLAAWVVFGTLLVGRWAFGWRGRIALRYTLAGFITLALAFFGTKLVLEVILQRV